MGLERPKLAGPRLWESPLELGLGEHRSPPCALASEGPRRPNSRLPPRPPLGPGIPARAQDRILVSPPKNSGPRSSERCLFPQAPRAAQSLKPEWPGFRQQGRKAGPRTPALPEALNYLPWARGSSSAGAARLPAPPATLALSASSLCPRPLI